MRAYTYDKKQSLVNFSNSLLKKYTGKTYYKSIGEIDHLIKKHDKICLILMDGFGKTIQDETLSDKAYIKKHFLMEISSTFPPTTVAATNSLLSGRYPIETGWVGWTMHFNDINKQIELFTGKDVVSREDVFKREQINETLPYVDILKIIKEHNSDVTVNKIIPFPIVEHGPKTILQFFETIDKTIDKSEKEFTYAYFLEPDESLHKFGVKDLRIKNICEQIDEETEKICKAHKDTLFILIADHSHIDVKPIFLFEYPDFIECLDGCFSLESRCANFRVKKGYEKKFIKLYKKYFYKYFDLVTKKEALKEQMFGPGTPNKQFVDSLGEFILIAIDNRYFEYDYKEKGAKFLSAHAGGTYIENIINVSAFNKK